jgi:hypothetical protein
LRLRSDRWLIFGRDDRDVLGFEKGDRFLNVVKLNYEEEG